MNIWKCILVLLYFHLNILFWQKKLSTCQIFIPHYIITRLHYVWCQMNSAVMLLQIAEAGTLQHMVKLHNISHFGACSSPVSGWQSASVNKISSEMTYWLTYRRQCSFWTGSEAGTGFEWKQKHMYVHKHTHTFVSSQRAWAKHAIAMLRKH